MTLDRFLLRKWLFCAILSVIFMSNFLMARSYTVPSKQFKSIASAIVKAKRGDTVWVSKGIYREAVVVAGGVVLISRELFGAKINAVGAENGISVGNGSVISGFEVVNARIGVYTEGPNITIRRCYIHDNQQSGIVSVGHLPDIEDNIISKNGGSGIQGWDVRTTMSTINHNTIAYNYNNGISVGGNSDIVIENNILAYNSKIGVKADPGTKVVLRNNVFYLNTEVVQVLPEGNYSFDPMFISSSTGNFMLSDKSRARNMGSDGGDIGIRLVY